MYKTAAIIALAISPLAMGADTTDNLVSEQESIIAEAIKEDAIACAKGTQEGTIGYSIKQALNMHMELASATPNVESLFDVSNNCFSGLSQIFDLSFAIPSLGSIIGAVTGAVKSYAEKKVCSAVGEVTGMVTGPINQAIGNVNSYGAYGLNGMTNGLVREGLSQIDPNLGSRYHPSRDGTYTIGINPFNKDQTDFGGMNGETFGQPMPQNGTRNSIPDNLILNQDNADNTDNTDTQDDGGFINQIGDLFGGGG